MNVQWSKYVFTEEFFGRVNSIAQKSLGNSVSAEEAATYVIEKLSANNWEKCSSYKGNCSPETYLYRLASGLVVDFIRRQEGRLRPPSWLQKEGDLWVNLWKDLCLKRENVNQVIAIHSLDGYRDPSIIKSIISVIKSKLPWCGVSKRPVSIDEEGAGYGDIGQETSTNLQATYTREHAMEIARCFLSGDDSAKSESYDSSFMGVLSTIAGKVALSDEERLILKMHFCDGMSFSAIARGLGVPKHQPVRQIKKILETYRTMIEESGYGDVLKSEIA